VKLADPLYLWLLLPVLLLAVLYLTGKVGKEASIRFSNLRILESAGAKRYSLRRILAVALRTAVLCLVIIAIARPQTGHGLKEETKNVIDVMLVLDTSSSMATLDFHPDNRLTAAKIEADRFIKTRPDDRVGLVVFAKHGITQSPLTTDQAALLALLKHVEMGILEDGTAIGVGLAIAVNRLKDSQAKSKVVILLTDGINNSGEIDPLTAARIAKEYGVRVYTIGMGVDGSALMPIQDPRYGRRLVQVETEIDEGTLREMSRITQGLYFRAKDERALRRIFDEIDKLEKTEIKVRQYTRYDEHYPFFLWLAFAILCAELLLMHVVMGKMP